MPKTDVTAERAARLVDALRQQREQGGTAYPLTVSQLKEAADPEASEEDLFKALGKKPYAEQVLVAGRKDPTSPIVLSEDIDLLLKSPLLLEYALSKVCSAEKPLQPLAKVVGAVDKNLREDFLKVLQEQAEKGTWPEGVGQQDVKGTPNLFLKKFPPPPPKKSPTVELAERLLTALRAHQEKGGADYPTTLARLTAEADPEGTGNVKKAVSESAFQSQALIVPVSKTDTLVVLAEDANLLTGSPLLLEGLLKASTSAKKPYISLAKLAEVVPESLRSAFVNAVQQQVEAGSLPEPVGAKSAEGDVELHLKANVPDHVKLADRLVERLHQLREEGPDRYPPTWAELVELAAPETPELVGKVLADKAFKNQVVFALPGNPQSPVALQGDEAQLAGSPRLVEFAVGLASTAEQPLHPVSKIAGKLDKNLRAPFEKAVADQVEKGSLPAGVAAVDVKGKLHLHLKEHPLPTNPVEDLVADLLTELREARDAGEDYPTTVANLLSAVEADPSDPVTKKALAHKAFTKGVVLAQPGNPDSLLVLAEDQDRLLEDPRLVQYTLAATRTPDNQALPSADLAKKVGKDLQGAFVERLERQAEQGQLPNGVGCLRIKGKPYFFLTTEIVSTARQVPAPAPAAKKEAAPAARTEEESPANRETIDFAQRFDAAFEKLDRQEGSHNLVSLVDLREALPVEREVFDDELQRLRRKGRYSLSGAEGRHGLSEEEQEAGIPEDGSLLLYVSRRSS